MRTAVFANHFKTGVTNHECVVEFWMQYADEDGTVERLTDPLVVVMPRWVSEELATFIAAAWAEDRDGTSDE